MISFLNQTHTHETYKVTERNQPFSKINKKNREDGYYLCVSVVPVRLHYATESCFPSVICEHLYRALLFKCIRSLSLTNSKSLKP